MYNIYRFKNGLGRWDAPSKIFIEKTESLEAGLAYLKTKCEALGFTFHGEIDPDGYDAADCIFLGKADATIYCIEKN